MTPLILPLFVSMIASVKKSVNHSRTVVYMRETGLEQQHLLTKNTYACASTKITWSISDKVIGLEAKSPRNIVKMKEEMAAFLVSGSVVVLLPP